MTHSWTSARILRSPPALPPATCNTDLADPSRYLMGGETYLVVEYEVPADRAPQAPRADPGPTPPRWMP